jgi:hypothetical protein
MNIKKLRGAVLRRKEATTPQQLDAESILQDLAAIRKKIPFLESAPRLFEDGRARASDGMPLQTVEDFEYAAIEDALESLCTDLSRRSTGNGPRCWRWR